MDGSSVQIAWEAPISGGRGGPVAGYQVEYRPIGQPSWLTASDRLIFDTQHTGTTTAPRPRLASPRIACATVHNQPLLFARFVSVQGLRPNGEYEFRVFARNAEGLSEPSQSSGPFRVRPSAPPRSPNTFLPSPSSSSYSSGRPI